jgi:hypothetical protein
MYLRHTTVKYLLIPGSRELFWGRFSAELTIHKEMIDAVTGDSIQASGAPASRPQPTEPRREGRVDPNAVAAA